VVYLVKVEGQAQSHIVESDHGPEAALREVLESGHVPMWGTMTCDVSLLGAPKRYEVRQGLEITRARP
jgi:hypothetical protein